MIYLPFADFTKCAKCFDDYTLRKQCIQILRLLAHLKHFANILDSFSDNLLPCEASLWRQTPGALAQYGLVLAQEVLNRGFNNSWLIKIAPYQVPFTQPKWMGWEPFHASHRAALIKFDENRLIIQAIHQFLCCRYPASRLMPTVAEWLADEFGLCSRDLYYRSLNNIKHWLLERQVTFRANHYSMTLGFTESSNLPLAWPYFYVEEQEQCSLGRRPRPSRTNRLTAREEMEINRQNARFV